MRKMNIKIVNEDQKMLVENLQEELAKDKKTAREVLEEIKSVKKIFKEKT